MDERKSFVFARQYRNCFSRRINALVPRNQPIKTDIGMVTHNFYGLKTMTFYHVADIAYFWLTVKLQLHYAIYRLRFYSNSLIHVLSLSNLHNNVASIQKNRGDKSHRVIVLLQR